MVGFVAAVPLAFGAAASDDACSGTARIADFGADGRIGAKYVAATRTVAYGRTGPDGHFHTFLSNTDGAHEQRLVSSDWREDRHQFPAAWHPSGRWLVLLVEKDHHPGSSTDATPGYGAYTDYWLVAPDGSGARRLYELPQGYDAAITHAAFSPDGSKFVWTERVRRPKLFDLNLFAGAYVFKVADFVDDGQPHLANVRTIRPGDADQGGEVESMADDNRTIAFYSTYVSKNLFASRIYTMDIESGVTRELTSESFAQAPTFTPDGRSIVYMTGAGADVFPFQVQGADWWIMDRDGGHKRRLTTMNVRASAQSVGRYRLAGSLSFVDDHAFYGDVLTQPLGLVGKIVRVDCLERAGR